MSYLSGEFDDKIVGLLKGGGVGVLPSDTIYGLSCLALNERAVRRIRELKGRSEDKPLIILISDLRMIEGLGISPDQVSSVKDYWPGALSLGLSAPPAPRWLITKDDRTALRMPADTALRTLIRQVGPLVSTSANPEGSRPAATISQARRYFSDEVDFYVDHGRLDNPPSTLVIAKAGKLMVVRQGAVNIKQEDKL